MSSRRLLLSLLFASLAAACSAEDDAPTVPSVDDGFIDLRLLAASKGRPSAQMGEHPTSRLCASEVHDDRDGVAELTLTYTFGRDRRLERIDGTRADGTAEAPQTFDWDARGRLVAVSSEGRVHHFGYDDRGRLVSERLDLGPEGEETFDYADFDDADDPRTRVRRRGERRDASALRYDEHHRLIETRIDEGGDGTVELVTKTTYDDAARRVARRTSRADGTPVREEVILFDDQGRRTSDTRRDLLSATEVTTTYTRDKNRRITSIESTPGRLEVFLYCLR